jgi:tetratricopeptide (TPR) repeat protein
MKKTIQLLSICAVVAVLALPAFAHDHALPTDKAVQDQCSVENKTALYNDFLATYKTDNQAKAYDDAKKYLGCPADANDPDDAKRVAFLQKFVTAYEQLQVTGEKTKRKAQLTDLVYVKKDYPKAFELGRQILADEPDYFQAFVDLGYAGYAAFMAGNKSFANDGATYGKKAIEIIESGKTPADWKPATSKEDVLAKLNYWIATLKQDSAPSEAIAYWIKAASSDNFKKDVQTYYKLGLAYEIPARKLLADYNNTFNGKPETPESKLALENVNQMIDRTIDALARAVALSGSDEKYKELKADAMGRLTDFYKLRHPSTAGLDELIAGILSKPLPPEPKPITSLPTTPTTGTPAATTTKTAGPIKPRTRRAHVPH